MARYPTVGIGLGLLLVFSTTCGWCQEGGVTTRTIGSTTYELELVFENDFKDLSQWIVETTGSATTQDNSLVWDCLAGSEPGDQKYGTIWCRERFEGPTVVEYDAIARGGANNLNLILYATRPPEGLLETTHQRTGEYGEYHVFPNYIVTYLTNDPSQWRLRLRKNPGFHLLTERYEDADAPLDRKQRLTYVCDGQGKVSFYVEGNLKLQYHDQEAPYRSGYHGLRTWNSVVEYSRFRVHSIVGEVDSTDPTSASNPPR